LKHRGVSPCQGETGAFLGAERGSFVSAPSEPRDYESVSAVKNHFEHLTHLSVYLFIPKPNYAIAPFTKISRSGRVSSFFALLSMLAAVEFDDHVPLDATKICKITANAVLPAEFETGEALGSEIAP
jgi:hypothetical protein